MLGQIFKVIFSHKIIFSFLGLAVIVAGIFVYRWFATSSGQPPSYVTEAVQKGSITVTISGTGQVAVSNQVDVKPEVSAKVTALYVTPGQKLSAGDLIVQLDATEALKSVRDAQASLASAQLSLDKLMQPADDLSVIQAQHALAQAQEAKPTAAADLAATYEDGFNNVSNAFLDLPGVITGVYNVLFDADIDSGQNNIDYYVNRVAQYDNVIYSYEEKALSSYQTARSNYETVLAHYQNTSRDDDEQAIEDLILETYGVTRDIADAIKQIKSLIDFSKDTLTENGASVPAAISTHQTELNNYTDSVNGHLSKMLSSKNAIDSAKQAIINADRDITEQQEKLADLLADPDALDVKSEELSIKQKRNALLDAQQKLADYSVRAPFDGIVADVGVQKGESVSSGSAAATLITDQKVAEITLNEIDAAKLQIGQKAILQFDAIQDLSISGQVAEIDTLGTVSQGVVSYGVKIAFDVQDERIKPGMSLSATIIIDSKQDVLVVPSAAVKSVGSFTYVETLIDGTIQQLPVTTGLSNDTSVEITEGVAEGDEIITQTISAAATSVSNTRSTQSGGVRSGGGEMMIFSGPPR